MGRKFMPRAYLEYAPRSSLKKIRINPRMRNAGQEELFQFRCR